MSAVKEADSVMVKGKEYALLKKPIVEIGGRAIALARTGSNSIICSQLREYAGKRLKIVGVDSAVEGDINEHVMVAFTLASSQQPPSIAIKLGCFGDVESLKRMLKEVRR